MTAQMRGLGRLALRLIVPVTLSGVLVVRGWPILGAVLVSLPVALLWQAALLLSEVVSSFGVRVALRVASHLFRLAPLLRRCGWTAGGCVWARVIPGGINYLAAGTQRGSLTDPVDISDRLAAALGVDHASWTEAWFPGWVWVSVRYVDPLGSPRLSLPRSLSAPPGTALVGRRLDGSDAVTPLEPGLHLAIQGNTGSGKSNLARLLLLAAVRAGMMIIGSDVSGLLLGGLPFTNVVIGSERVERHVTLLERTVEEMDRTLRALAAAGVDHWSKLPAARAQFLVVEELPGLVACLRQADRLEGRRPADRLTSRLETALGRLCAEGRKAGVIVLAIAQRFDADLLGGAARNNFAIRVSLRGDCASVAMLHSGCSLQVARRHSDLVPGVGLIEWPGQPAELFGADVLTAGMLAAAVKDLIVPAATESGEAARSEA